MIIPRSIILLICVTLALQIKGQSEPPHLKNGQLIVDGKPYIVVGGELYNSSASTIAYMEEIWPKLRASNINTVLATITWDQFEPKEGDYDFTMIDYLIEKSMRMDLKLIVVWFGSWKNGQSSYVPSWVKRDTERFWRAKTRTGLRLETLSVFCTETKNADSRAFAQLMRRIREIDDDQTVIMVQPENEVGLFQEVDYSEQAQKAFETDVPLELLRYFERNKSFLKPEVMRLWEDQGFKDSGSWSEVFGESPLAKSVFMTWYYASFLDFIAQSGKSEYNLPMFVNAWIVQKEGDLPGIYPNGGPVAWVMDIYKAAAPNIDLQCPDIYLTNYMDIYEAFYRKDNPLFIPESTVDAARAFYAIAEYDAIGFSPFGIEDAEDNVQFRESYKVLNELVPIIAQYQNKGQMYGIDLNYTNQDRVIEMEDYHLTVKIQDPSKPAYGMIIITGEEDFLVVGMNFKVLVSGTRNEKSVYVEQVLEGGFDKTGKWVTTRWLNGDETYHNELVRALGRNVKVLKSSNSSVSHKAPEIDKTFVYSSNDRDFIKVPGIYKVKIYFR